MALPHKHNIHVTFRALYLFRVNGSQLVHCISLVWRNLVVLLYIYRSSQSTNESKKLIQPLNRTMLRNVVRLLGPCHSWQTKALPVALVQPLLFPSSSMDTKVFVALMKGPGKWKTIPNLLWQTMDSDFDTFRFSFSNKTFEWSVSEVVRKSFIFGRTPRAGSFFSAEGDDDGEPTVCNARSFYCGLQEPFFKSPRCWRHSLQG